jgi:hypothetical protein
MVMQKGTYSEAPSLYREWTIVCAESFARRMRAAPGGTSRGLIVVRDGNVARRMRAAQGGTSRGLIVVRDGNVARRMRAAPGVQR